MIDAKDLADAVGEALGRARIAATYIAHAKRKPEDAMWAIERIDAWLRVEDLQTVHRALGELLDSNERTGS